MDCLDQWFRERKKNKKLKLIFDERKKIFIFIFFVKEVWFFLGRFSKMFERMVRIRAFNIFNKND